MTARDKIKPAIDVPLILQMEQVYGQEVPSQFTGLEYRFTVVFEERPAFIYLPKEGRDAILQARPEVGDFIELLKRKRNNRVTFSAKVLSDANEEPQPRRTQSRNGRYSEDVPSYQSNYEDDPFARRDEPPPPPRQMRQLPQPEQQQPRSQASAHGQAQPPRPEATNISPIAQQLAGCLRVSIDAWEEAVAYARLKNVQLDYTSEDVRAVGLSFYINAVERGFFSPQRNGNGGRR